MADDYQLEDEERRPLLATAVVGLLLVLAVIGGVLWFTRDGEAAPDPRATSPPVASDKTEPTASAPTASTAGPSEVIPGWSKADVAGLVVPVSTQAGPHDLSEGRARDFERSELGAVMAAAHLAARVSGYATPEVYEATIAEQVVPGENAQRLLSTAIATYEDASQEQGRSDPRSQAVLRGYRVPTYSDEAATVELWSEASGPTGVVRVATPAEVVWRNDQWMLLPSGLRQEGRELVETSRFTEFPPEVR